MWPGFEPQVFNILNNIFPMTFTCSIHVQVHHTPSRIQHTRAPGDQIKGWELMDTLRMSQRVCTCHAKSTKAMLNGPALFGLIPPYWGLPPPLVCNVFFNFLYVLFYFPLFVYLFCCFNLINYFYKKYKNIIKNRKGKKYNKYFILIFSCK